MKKVKVQIRLRRAIKKQVEQLTGLRISRGLPHGVDLFFDISRTLPRFLPRMVFDVGANVGQSAEEFLRHFPAIDLFCFEPASNTYRELQENMRRYPNVRCFQKALGMATGTATLVLHEESVFNSLSFGPSDDPIDPSTIETVEVESLTALCGTHGIESIDLLKIDTEGEDLQVLKGAGGLLEEGRIGMIQVEAGMNPENTRHVPFASLVDFMQSHGYYLFGIYEQFTEKLTGNPFLRRTNPVFISQQTIAKCK